MNNNYFEQFIKLKEEEIDDLHENCFHHFRNKEDNDALLIEDFHLLLNDLFPDSEKKEGNATFENQIRDIFNVFDINADQRIDKNEFLRMWNTFIKSNLKPKSALIVIDVQNDFIDGSLAIRNCPAAQEGFDVVPVINSMVDNIPFNTVIYTYDWHPEDHISFIDNVQLRKLQESYQSKEVKVFDTVVFESSPPIEQKLWPRHCVQGSWGSELHPKLKISDGATFIYKGTNSGTDSYSAFWDNQKRSQTNLADELKTKGITDVFICGLAYDYCVGFSALHALEHGFRTILVEDAVRGVSDDDINIMKKKLISKHGSLVNSDEVLNMTNGYKRKWELGYFSAMHLKTKNE